MVSENLTVTVTAITEAAEQKLNSLKRTIRSVGIASGGSTAGVGGLEGRVDSLARSALIGKTALAGLTDEIEEEGDEATTSAAQTGLLASTIGALTPAASGASVSLGVLSVTFQSLGAAIVVVTGALVVFGAVLASITAAIGGVIAGAGALAAAFTGIIGTGILAFGEQRGEQAERLLDKTNRRIESLEELRQEQGQLSEIQKENLEQLKNRQDELEDQTGIVGGLSAAYDELSAEITPLLVQFGREFAPLIESAIDRLPNLVREVLRAAGGLDQLREDVAALGRGFAQALPGIVRGTVNLARQAMPVFQDFLKFVGREGPDAIRLLVQTARENADEFTTFLNGFRDALPDIIAFGNFIINVLVPALAGLGQVLSPVVDALGRLNDVAKGIPDWVIDILKGTVEVAVSGGPLGFLAQQVAPTTRGFAQDRIRGATNTGGTPPIGVGQTRVNRSGASGESVMESDKETSEAVENGLSVNVPDLSVSAPSIDVPDLSVDAPEVPQTVTAQIDETAAAVSGIQTIEIRGEFVDDNGVVKAKAEEVVESNSRDGARSNSRLTGSALRGGK